jgi:hypothetical protein
MNLALLLLLGLTVPEAPPGSVLVMTEPRGRPVATISVRTLGSAKTPVVLPVRQGLATIPPTLPPPYEVTAEGFEPTVYREKGSGDGRHLVLRALGSLRGNLKGWNPDYRDVFWICYRPPGGEPEKISLRPEAAGEFEIPIKAGVYHGAVWCERAATRIRVGVVVRPGERTSLGSLELEKAGSVRFKILDAATIRPLQGAVASWDPPEGLNADISKTLFRSLWSAVSGSDGTTVIAGIFAAKLRWRVEAKGYVPVSTQVADPRLPTAVLPDVRLKKGSKLEVSLEIPPAFPRGVLRVDLANPDPHNPLRFLAGGSRNFRGSPVVFENLSSGLKRISVFAGSTLVLYQDVEITDSDSAIQVAPRMAVIHGSVSRGGRPVTGYVVRLSDPHDARTSLAEKTTDSDGSYRIETFQRGHLLIYARGPSVAGMHSGVVDKSVEATAEKDDLEVDFEMPAFGIRLAVRDEDSGAAIPHVRAKAQMEYADGSAGLTSLISDATGEFSFDDLPAGRATINLSVSGYQSKTIRTEFGRDSVVLTVPLRRASSASGSVLGPEGQAVAGATLSGGYPDPLSVAAAYMTQTDATGSFRFESPPESGTPLYVTAPGYALGIAYMHPGDDNLVTVTPLNSLRLFVLTDTGQPVRNFRLAVAAGGLMIPTGALDDLAEANGLNQRTLLATGGDGSSILPSFLGAGVYDFFLTLRREGRFEYQKLGTVRLPFSGDEILTFRPPKDQ